MNKIRKKKVESCDWNQVQDKLQENWKENRDREVEIKNNKKRPEKPLTERHLKYLQSIDTFPITLCTGPAGTGKTSLACSVAVRMLKSGMVSKIVLVRPLVQCDEELGILPGTLEEKMSPYLAPLSESLKEFLGNQLFENFAKNGLIEVCPLATMRGITYHNSIVILDEAQNATYGQLRMFLTRMGHNTHMVVNGDISQSDLYRGYVPLLDVVNRLEGNSSIFIMKMLRADVLRPELVSWIDEKLGEEEKPPKYGDNILRKKS